MKLRLLLAASLVAITAGVLPHAASAQGVTIDQQGVHVDPNYDRGYDRYDRHDQFDHGISPREARRIARSAGVADVTDISRRGDVWIVRGQDFHGRDIRVTVSARSGDVLNVRRYHA